MGGMAWAREKRPQRIRATYRRLKGTQQFLGFYDVHADCLNGVFRRRKRVREVSEAFLRLRRCYPRKRLFVVLDNRTMSMTTRASWPCCGVCASTRCGLPPKLPGSTSSKRSSES